ncbi:MAG: hypothetical protein H5U00_04935 [Clostridia bacterium]|nr:hypothetical protein [Clostridia bacterium]
MILGIERIKPGEGEVTAARRLLERVYRQQGGRFAEVIVADALYAGAPFINAVLEMHKDVVVKVKQTEREIIKDAEGIFSRRLPDIQKKTFTTRPKAEGARRTCYEVEIHDVEGFRSWQAVKEPLRVLRVKETLLKPDNTREEKPVYYLFLPSTSEQDR